MGRSIPAYKWTEQPFMAGPQGRPDQCVQVMDYTFDALLASEGHRRTKTGWSGGGPFFVYKEQKFHGTPATQPVRIGWEGQPPIVDDVWRPKGISPGSSYPGLQNLIESAKWAKYNSDLELPTRYAEGFAKARPGNPPASAFQFLYELKEMPSIPAWSWFNGVPFKQIPLAAYYRLKYFLKLEKELASNFLNIQFGWTPFVGDLRKMYLLWKSIDKTLAKLVRENGRNIRRKATVLSENDTTRETASYPYPWVMVNGPPASWQSGYTHYSVVRRTTRRIWFSGNFRYWIPDAGSSQWTRRATRTLFGVNPTPSQIWSVMPWTWLTDWFWNMGDIMSNLSQNAAENLVCNFSYIMEEKTTVVERTAVVKADSLETIFHRIPATYHTFQSTESLTTKARIGGGNPYGLGVKLGSLSGRQLAILGALGITRGLVK